MMHTSRLLVILLLVFTCLCISGSTGETVKGHDEGINKKIRKFTSNPCTRRYFSGALLGTAFAASVQPFKNAKDHFLVWDFKAVFKVYIFVSFLLFVAKF